MVKCICRNVEEICYCKIDCDNCKKQEPSMNTAIIEQSVSEMLYQFEGAEQWQREGLKQTPDRVARFYKQFLEKKEFNFTTFNEPGSNEMVVVKDIPFYSLCEHHMAPFFGTGHIGYIPKNDKIVGISKLPRVLDMFANRLQNQERIGKQVADFLMYHLEPRGVAVVLNARHMCMEMRGIKKAGASTVTSVMRGVFSVDMNARQEFLNFIK